MRKVIESKSSKDSQVDKGALKNCKSLIKLVDDNVSAIKRRLNLVQSDIEFGDSSVTAGELDDLKIKFDEFLSEVMKLGSKKG